MFLFWMLCFGELLCNDLNRGIWGLDESSFEFPEFVFFHNDNKEWEEKKEEDDGGAATVLVLSELCFALYNDH